MSLTTDEKDVFSEMRQETKQLDPPQNLKRSSVTFPPSRPSLPTEKDFADLDEKQKLAEEKRRTAKNVN